ncbi:MULTISPECIES: hypothetical protein [Streptomyces]|uniref:hypothetical protein n=1 Tax=Streptomyces TaxID=1883 RepID=UPI0029A8C893|nr:hypothetical protein [Streptomyces sp. ME02-6978.2a]MDX3360591.1 hypothetical protein [Streptomyces sp. ME02-6978.2a]
MQHPSSRPVTVALVGVTSFTGGVALTADDVVAVEPGVLLWLVCLIAALGSLLRRFAARQRRFLHDLLAHLARRHQAQLRALERREEDLREREEAFRLVAGTTQLRIDSAQARLDEVAREFGDERERRRALEAEYEHLVREYNDLLLETSDQAPAAQEQRSRVAVGQTGSGGHTARPRPNISRGFRPYLSLVDAGRTRTQRSD